MQTFAAPDVDDVWIGERNGNRSDRAGGLIIKDRNPRPAKIVGFKDTPIDRRHIKNVGLRRHAADRASPTTAVRADVAPAQRAAEIIISLADDIELGEKEKQENCATHVEQQR